MWSVFDISQTIFSNLHYYTLYLFAISGELVFKTIFAKEEYHRSSHSFLYKLHIDSTYCNFLLSLNRNWNMNYRIKKTEHDMIFKFSLVSDEVANFKREIQIDGDATFFDLHKIIMECSGYGETEITAFYMCDDWWGKKEQIALIEIETDSDVDVFVMEEETLSDWLDEEKQKLMFMFDYHGERAFYMELSEMILGKNLSEPTCSKKQGTPPPQFLEEEEEETVIPIVPPVVIDPTLEEDDEEEVDDDAFYGDEDFNEDELDMDGFEDVNGTDSDLDIPEDMNLQ